MVTAFLVCIALFVVFPLFDLFADKLVSLVSATDNPGKRLVTKAIKRRPL